MINKYTTTLKIQKDDSGTPYYATILPSKIPADTFQLSVVARAGERFDTLAVRYYKDATRWWIIAKANGLVNGSIFIPAGKTIIIPSAGL